MLCCDAEGRCIWQGEGCISQFAGACGFRHDLSCPNWKLSHCSSLRSKTIPPFNATCSCWSARFLCCFPSLISRTPAHSQDSCQNVHVSDVLIDVGDDAVSVKSGLHWRTRQKVPAADYLFERVTILFRNFAIGSSVGGDVRNITFRDSTIGDDLGSSPWAIKLKTDSQEGGVVDGVTFRNVRLGLITFCGSSKFVFPKQCSPGKETGATAIDMGMGYGGLEPTNPGILRNVVFDGVYGVGPTGVVANWRGLPGKPVCGVTVTNVTLKQGIAWECKDVSNVTLKDVSPSPKGSCVSTGVGAV